MTAIRVWLSRILDLLFSGRRERRLEEEIRTHLDLLTDQYVAAGMSPAEARQAARRSFGGVDQIKEASPRSARTAARRCARPGRRASRCRLMRRNPGFAVTAVLVLGLGIGVNNMLFTILNAHTLRGLPIPGSDRVLFISTIDDRGADRGVSFADYRRHRRAACGTIAAIAAFRAGPDGRRR